MRAIVFDPSAPNDFRFGDVAEPVPTAPDELLIQVRAISLNFGEVSTVDNAESPGDVPGWDSSGVVLEAAADGSGPPVGARVVGADWSQAWAQRRVLKSDNVAVIPGSLAFDTAARHGPRSAHVIRHPGTRPGVDVASSAGGSRQVKRVLSCSCRSASWVAVWSRLWEWL